MVVKWTGRGCFHIRALIVCFMQLVSNMYIYQRKTLITTVWLQLGYHSVVKITYLFVLMSCNDLGGLQGVLSAVWSKEQHNFYHALDREYDEFTLIQLSDIGSPQYLQQIQHTLTGRGTPRPHFHSLTCASTVSHQVVACVTTVGGCLSKCCSSGTNMAIGWVSQGTTSHNCWKKRYTIYTNIQCLAMIIQWCELWSIWNYL